MSRPSVAQKQAIYARPVSEQYHLAYSDAESGGSVLVHVLTDKAKPDFKDVLAEAIDFAKQGKLVMIPPEIHIAEKEARAKLLPSYGRANSNPDLNVAGEYWEVGRMDGKNKRNIKERLKSGIAQADNVILLLGNKEHEAYARALLQKVARRFIIK